MFVKLNTEWGVGGAEIQMYENHRETILNVENTDCNKSKHYLNIHFLPRQKQLV